MKKKCKVLNKLFTVFVAVLCMVMLCVPAFASSGTVILPETTFTYDQSLGGAVLEYEIPLVVGQEYTVVWNGVSYTSVCQTVEDDGALIVGIFPNLDSPEFPFYVGFVDGVTAFGLLDESALNPDDGTFTVSIYEGASGSSSDLSVNVSGTFTPDTSNDDTDQKTLYVPIVSGQKYLVTINGDEYIVTAFSSVGVNGITFLGFGNVSMLSYPDKTLADKSVPFGFMTAQANGSGMFMFYVDNTYNGEVTYTITNYFESFASTLMSDAGNVVASLTSWVGSVARMVINTPVLLIGFTIALGTLAFGVFKSLKR